MYVREGAFAKGSDSGNNEEMPAHAVNLDAYWAGKTVFTVALFANFVSEAEYQTTAEAHGNANVFQDGEWQQVEGADWAHPPGPK